VLEQGIHPIFVLFKGSTGFGFLGLFVVVNAVEVLLDVAITTFNTSSHRRLLATIRVRGIVS
jgi:hypothetical protein